MAIQNRSRADKGQEAAMTATPVHHEREDPNLFDWGKHWSFWYRRGYFREGSHALWNSGVAPSFEAIAGAICAHTRMREVMIQTPKYARKHAVRRYLTIKVYKDLSYLTWWLTYNYELPFNIYMSCNTYRFSLRRGDGGTNVYIPMTKPDMQDIARPSKTGKNMIEKFRLCESSIRASHDLMIDVDIPKTTGIKGAEAPPSRRMFEAGRRVALGVFDDLMKAGVTFEVRWSGCGYHFHAYGAQFHGEFSAGSMEPTLDLYKRIAEALRGRHGDFVDPTIYDARRVMKVPYTLAWYNCSQDVFVVAPMFSREELATFEPDDFRPSQFWAQRAHLETRVRYYSTDDEHGYGQDTTGTFNMDAVTDVDTLLRGDA